ncbi:MAG: glycosyltransferase family 4 protein [Desulfobacteraceae bacterium]|nr:glycosyltransferase family 4 protein [Desulfobacteraceae bacterium]
MQITPEFPPNCGGIGYYVFYLSKELIERGYNICVLLRGKRERDYVFNGVPVREVSVVGHPPLNMPLFKKRIESVLREAKPDLIHTHSTSMPTLKCDYPVMVTAHHCMKESVPIIYHPIKDLDGLYKNIFLPVYKYITTKLVQSCDKLTVVSNSLRNEFEKHYNVKSEVVYNAVNTNLFSVAPVRKENAILFVGPLRVGKGVFDLLDIASLLRQSHPDIKIYIAGGGPSKHCILRQIHKRGLTQVILLNSLPHHELNSLYNRSRVFVLPTYYEGLPTTILEAMACELPVVASNVSGIPDLIDEGVNGYMVRPGDVDGFYRKIVELLEDPEKCGRFGKAGKQKVLERFTWRIIADRIVEIYHEVLVRHKESNC